jgi:hypothetical protein
MAQNARTNETLVVNGRERDIDQVELLLNIEDLDTLIGALRRTPETYL